MSFTVDRREFDRALREYRKYSKRDLATIVNTKALFIAKRAIIETPKADRSHIEKELGEFKSVLGPGRKGKALGRKVLVLANSLRKAAPLAALIVNARRGRAGERGLHGPEMAKAVRAMLASRFRSIAFLKSGWLPAIRALLPFADKYGAPRTESGVRQLGQAKGSATPARDADAWRVKATITNSASGHDEGKALLRFGAPALQRAFDAEAASMREYIERKLKESAGAAGIKHG